MAKILVEVTPIQFQCLVIVFLAETVSTILGKPAEEMLLVVRRPARCHATARSVEDETRNGDWNANRNPKRNQETTVLWLFSNFQVKRDLKQ